MKIFADFILFLSVVLTVLWNVNNLLTTPEQVRVRKENAQVEKNQATANEVVSKIIYIKDCRTGRCFAYFQGSVGYGGPSFTCVPCEGIPRDLLTHSQIGGGPSELEENEINKHK